MSTEFKSPCERTPVAIDTLFSHDRLQDSPVPSVLKSFYENCFAWDSSVEPTSQDNSLVGYDDRDTTRSQNTTVPASTLADEKV